MSSISGTAGVADTFIFVCLVELADPAAAEVPKAPEADKLSKQGRLLFRHTAPVATLVTDMRGKGAG